MFNIGGQTSHSKRLNYTGCISPGVDVTRRVCVHRLISQRHWQIGSVIPGWLWILAFLSIGGFVMLVGYMENYQSNKLPGSESASSTQQTPATAKTATDKSKPTTFDFYNLLPELEKIIPDRDTGQHLEREKPKDKNTPAMASPITSATTKKTIAKPTAVAPEPNSVGGYYIQAGSFKDFKAADSRRASLALIGVESRIQNADIPGRGLWYRVRIGPFLTLSEMRQTRKLLKNSNIVSIMLTVKK